MSTPQMTVADMQLRSGVTCQLDWDAAVNASGIGVAVKDGVATLSGYTDSYPGKLAAERAAKRVRGIRAVANEIEVTRVTGRTDTDIASDLVHALRVHTRVPESVQATVNHGHVTLTGRVDWLFQKQAAERAVGHVHGVRHVATRIVVAPKAVERDVRQHVVKALHENAETDARQIDVSVAGHTVTLTGSTGSLLQREAAEWAAAQTPGVAEVDNRILVVNRNAPASGVDSEC